MDIDKIIHNCLNEASERQAVKQIIREELRRMYNEGVFEEGNHEKKEDEKEKKKGESKKNTHALTQLEKFFDENPYVKKSTIAYDLYPDMDPNSARHVLQDKLEGEKPSTTTELNKAENALTNIHASMNEDVLRKALSEAIKTVLKEDELKVGTKFPIGNNNPVVYAKILAKKYGVEPDDFRSDGVSFVYEPKKKIRKKISKPEDMSLDQYYALVLDNNKKMAQEEERYPDEEWRPVQNEGRYFKGDADFSGTYEVSNYGRLRVIDFNDAEKSRIDNGYPAPTRKAMQFHLNTTSMAGKKMQTCPDVKYMVATAWLGPHDPNKYKVIHKDGDWTNNKAENLEWVEK